MHFVAYGRKIRHEILLQQCETDVEVLRARLREAMDEQERATLEAVIRERKRQFKREEAALSRMLF